MQLLLAFCPSTRGYCVIRSDEKTAKGEGSGLAKQSKTEIGQNVLVIHTHYQNIGDGPS